MATGGLWLAASLPLAAAAQDAATSPDGRDRSVPAATASERLSRLQVFRPAFYADRRPRTALDIVVATRSEEHTSELQSLMRTSYAVFRLQKKIQKHTDKLIQHQEHTNESN